MVIGAHPHRISGFEIINNTPILYSIGNFIFPDDFFFNGKLNFPSFCKLQLAFELDVNGNHKCHFFKYKKSENIIKYLYSEDLSNSPTLNEYSKFSSLSHKLYNKWFKENRIQKKILPIYYSHESEISLSIKNVLNYLRTLIIKIIVKYFSFKLKTCLKKFF